MDRRARGAPHGHPQIETRTTAIDQKINKLEADLKKMREQMSRMPEGPAKVRHGARAPNTAVALIRGGRRPRPVSERRRREPAVVRMDISSER